MEHPMNQNIRSNLVSARSVAAGVWFALCAIIFAPPLLASSGGPAAAAIIYFLFSPVCHQMPERSFALLGIPLAVCHRCCGIYFGLFLGSLMKDSWMHRSPMTRRRCVLAATIPLALDALLPYTELWANTDLSRLITGLWFGIPTASLLVRGIEEFLNEAPWQRFALGDSSFRKASYE
jgi:uncharacterized membrane protein